MNYYCNKILYYRQTNSVGKKTNQILFTNRDNETTVIGYNDNLFNFKQGSDWLTFIK